MDTPFLDALMEFGTRLALNGINGNCALNVSPSVFQRALLESAHSKMHQTSVSPDMKYVDLLTDGGTVRIVSASIREVSIGLYERTFDDGL